MAYRRRVLLVMYWWEDRVMAGAARYAAEHDWELDFQMRWTHTIEKLSNWRGDGIIANTVFTHPLRDLVQVLHRAGVPIVGAQ